MPYCTACGGTVEVDDNFCEQCGDRLSDRSQADTDQAASDAEPDPFRQDPVSFGLGYPVTDSYEPLIVGSIAALIGFVLPPVLLVPAGYAIRVGSAAARGEPTPPDFEDIGGLFVDGVRAVVVLAVLWGVVAIVGASMWALGLELGAGTPAVAVAAVGATLVGLYATPAVLATYSVTGRVGAAFAQGVAGEFAVQSRYAKAFLSWLVIMTIGTVCLLVSTPFIIGPAVVGTHMLTVSAAFWGYQYRAAADDGVVPAAERAGTNGVAERPAELARSS